MKGTVIAVDFKAGEAIIGGDDRVSYGFGPADWKENLPPTEGQRVDFVPVSGSRATEVRIEAGTPTRSTAAWAATPPAGVATSAPVSPPQNAGAGDQDAAQPGEPAPAKPLLDQWSFRVTFGLCVFWIAVGVGLQVADRSDLSGGIFFAVVTILAYLLYRKLRGWKVIPPRRQPGTARSQNGLGVLVLVTPLIVFLGFASAVLPESASREPRGGQDAPWTKSLAGTTCGDWKTVMTSQQRRAFAEAELADARADVAPGQAAANLATVTVGEYTRMTDDICTYVDPGWLVSVSVPDDGTR